MVEHTGRLLDRHAGDRLTLRVQTDRGTCMDVYVLEEDREAAAALWGGAHVRWEYRGGRAFFLAADEAADEAGD